MTAWLAPRNEFKCCGPVLLVVPADMLAFWEGEFAFWAGRHVNVVTYAGSAHVRGTVLDNELWLQPSSMDGKSATYQSREALPKKVRIGNAKVTYLSLGFNIPSINP